MRIETLIRNHPWVILVAAAFPPIYIIGVIRTWGQPEYQVTLIDLFDVGVTTSACFWWPINLYNRKRRK